MPTAPREDLRKRERPWPLAFLVFVVAVAFYGGLAVQTGLHNSPVWNGPGRPEALVAARAKVDSETPSTALSSTEWDAFPAWMQLLAKVGSPRYAFGSNSMSEACEEYALMPASYKVGLSAHMALGGLCVTLGLFQFWPWFRKKYPRAHRRMGAVYMGAACVAMAMSARHLLRAGPEHTYQGFTFYVGLWLLVFGVLLALAAATRSLWKRDLRRHLGWQAIGYGLLLTAPVQRYDWIVLGGMYPEMQQGTLNHGVNVALLWQCLVLAYGLFLWNRSSSPRRGTSAGPSGQEPEASLGAGGGVAKVADGAPRTQEWWRTGPLVLWALAWGALLFLADRAPSLGGNGAARNLVPASVVSLDNQVVGASPWRWVFLGAVFVAWAGARWASRKEAEPAPGAAALTYAAALVAGGIAVTWGWTLGRPATASLLGGTFYGLCGGSLMAFASAAAWAQFRGAHDLRREWAEFLGSFCAAPLYLHGFLGLFYVTNLVPDPYLAQGHGYEMAAAAALTTSMIRGFRAAIFGPCTEAHDIR